MANYFVINSKFQPYSFDELMKPYQMYAEEYDKQAALLDAAREKEFSPDSLDKDADAVAYDMYNNAATGLKAASDELATRGLSSKLKAQIRNTARDYKRTMDSLNQAQERLFAEQDRRAKLGPDYVYQQNNLRIGDFLNGATPNQRGESLTAITNDIATEFARRAKGVSTDTWSKLIDSKGKVIGGYYDVTTRSGLEAGQLDLILNTDEATWKNIIADKSIPQEQKETLQRFRDVIANKKAAVGFDKFDSESDKARIQSAIDLGATAGLVTEQHSYKEDKSYVNPYNWAQLNFQQRQYNDRLAEAEAPYTHSDEKKPGPGNRTGFKPGWSIKNGKLQYIDPNDPNATAKAGGEGTDYTTKTKSVTVNVNGQTQTYADLNKAREGTVHKNMWGNQTGETAFNNLKTVAIEDITDPDIQREMLSRLNIPNANVSDANLPSLIVNNLARLNQLTVQVNGAKGDKDYVWVISDKDTVRLTGEDTPQVDYNSKEL